VGAVIAIVIIVFVVLFVLSKSVNSINKSVQRMQGRDRCVACKRRLKAVNGVYAQKCAKCGANQPTNFDRGMTKSKLVLQTGERGLYLGDVSFDSSKGQLVLTNRRLHFRPSGRDQSGRDWPLENVKTVVRLTDVGGFAVDVRSGERYVFRAGKKTQWYDQVFTAANSPTIKRLRSQLTTVDKTPTSTIPSAAIPRVTSPRAQAQPQTGTPVPPPPGTPAGWLADPVGQYEQRYWDGSRWTEHVSSEGQQTTDFL
jgi:hypothetical protein